MHSNIMKSTFLENLIKLSRFSLPITTNHFLGFITNFISMNILASSGQIPMAASGLAMPALMTIVIIASAVLDAVSILISHKRVIDDHATETMIKNGFVVAMMLAAPAACILWKLGAVLLFFHQDPLLVSLCIPFFHFAALAIFPSLLTAVINQYFLGMGKSKYTLYINLCCIPFTLMMSYIFILGKLGAPQMGLSGISCANLVVQSTLLVGLISWLYKNHHQHSLFTEKHWFKWSVCRAILKSGFPMGIQLGGELGAIAVMTWMLGYFGAVPLAASQLVTQYFLIIFMLVLALNQAQAILISQAYATKDYHAIGQYLTSSLVFLTLYCIVAAILFCGFPDRLVSFYLKKAQIGSDFIHLTRVFFIISVFYLLFDGIRIIFSGVLRGIHQSQVPMRVGIITVWIISMPMAYIAAFLWHCGPIGVRLGFLSGYVVASFILGLRIINFLRRLKYAF